VSIELRNKVADLERRIEALERRGLLPAVDVIPLEQLMKPVKPGQTLSLPKKNG
jgi:hypothetical protein